MFKPLAMKHVRLQLLTDELPHASLVLAELGVFSPDPRPKYTEEFPEIPGVRYAELYQQARSRFDKILRHIPLDSPLKLHDIHEIREEDLIQANQWLRQVWRRCSAHEEETRRLREQERAVRQLQNALANFAHLDIDLSLLQGDKHFLKFLPGTAPRHNIPQLRDALALAGFFLFEFLVEEDHVHVIVAGPQEEGRGEIRSLLDTAGFSALELPPELNDEPERVRDELAGRLAKIRAAWDAEAQSMAAFGASVQAQLEASRRTLAMAEPFVQLETAIRSSGSLSLIRGWAPAREVERLRETLKRRLDQPFVLLARDPEPNERSEVPTALLRNRLLAPFATLIKQYGVPRYGEIDPTVLFGISFIFMFGMMFGDIGHGLLIALAGWHWRGKLYGFAPFVIGNGLSATLFGFLYGSLFGYEGVIHHLWIAPLSDPLYMLSVALAWGVGFLVLISLVNIHNKLVIGLYTDALLGANGVVSLTLYLSLLTGLYRVLEGQGFGIGPALLLIGSIVALLIYKGWELKASMGERIVIAVVETFETLTGYLSNTLSFLRVAAFSLNHVALAIAVFTLAESMGTVGHWTTVVLGNLFILVLEGAIVTIQVLRLEYYEGFSRFFSGDGKEFRPLRLAGSEAD